MQRPGRSADQGEGQPGADVRGPRARSWSTKPSAGDIVLVTGIDEVGIGATLCDLEHPEALPLLKVDEPTLTMNFLVNTSPLAGREGKYVTSRQIRERLERETARATSRCASRRPSDTDTFIVSGRGELHLTILIENMRREGYELAVSRPRVVFKDDRRRALRAVRGAHGRRRGRATRAR